MMVDHSTELVLKDAAVFLKRLDCVTLVHLSSPQPQLSTLGRLMGERIFLLQKLRVFCHSRTLGHRNS